MPSRMASVSGSRTVVRVPTPATDSISIRPPRAATFFLTTSMPTPRPETSVTSAAVEKPGSKMSCHTSPSVKVSGAGKPLSRALARIRSRCSPAPSSLTSMTIFPPCWDARKLMVPTAGLPAAARVQAFRCRGRWSCAPGESAGR